MNREKLKKKLPTFYGYLEKRQQKKKNQLPRHMRPPSRWPLAQQLALNLGIIYTYIYLMWFREDFYTEHYPALAMVVCIVLLFFTVPSAVRLLRRFKGIKGFYWARANFCFMVIAALLLPVCISYYIGN